MTRIKQPQNGWRREARKMCCLFDDDDDDDDDGDNEDFCDDGDEYSFGNRELDGYNNDDDEDMKMASHLGRSA